MPGHTLKARLRWLRGRKRPLLWGLGCLLVVFVGAVSICTVQGRRGLPLRLTPRTEGLRQVQYLDRNGNPLSMTFNNDWNYHDQIQLHQVPEFLRQAIVRAEDKRFYLHHGVDLQALAAASLQNAVALRVIRGGSTVSEQVVRMLHPRRRTLWSRWLEIVEALELESRFAKAEILEFYLNQVPYGRRRRGIKAAALDLYNRDLDTLSGPEMLSLAVLIRAPERLDPRGEGGSRLLKERMLLLAKQLTREGLPESIDIKTLESGAGLQFETPELPVQATHFLRFAGQLRPTLPHAASGSIRTTIDSSLQGYVQQLLDRRVQDLGQRQVTDAAALVVDNKDAQILAWVNSGDPETSRYGQVDAVLVPRQPGSTLKPFLYALALENGWSAATLIDDAPLLHAVGAGIKPYRNYSGRFYGPVRLREALGNSLNIPAVRTMNFVGRPAFYELLHALEFGTLSKHPDYYGDGLALGNGEVRLLDLVRAYVALAWGGIVPKLRMFMDEAEPTDKSLRVFDVDVASLIGSILSDPAARQLEFGGSNLLDFPVQTAVKTGTSSDYRDAWAIGYSKRFTAGVWMGNLDRTPMHDVTGSTGPAIVLRALMAKLESDGNSEPLWLDRSLIQRDICADSGELAADGCPAVQEWFVPGSEPHAECHLVHGGGKRELSRAAGEIGELRLELPTPGLQLARDPRIPDDKEAFPLSLPAGLDIQRTHWLVDDVLIGETGADTRKFVWLLSPGRHTAQARVWLRGQSSFDATEVVQFTVK